jgi:hypothetical protein
LETEFIEAAVKGAAEQIRKTPAVSKRKNVSYAIVVKVGYEEIQKLRDDGYSYDIICKILSENGTLDAVANPKNFCTAFLRETKRRLSRIQRNNSNGGTNRVNAPAEKTDSIAENSNKAAQNNERGEVKKTEREKEQIRAKTGTVVDTGLGRIIKHPDGSFDY